MLVCVFIPIALVCPWKCLLWAIVQFLYFFRVCVCVCLYILYVCVFLCIAVCIFHDFLYLFVCACVFCVCVCGCIYVLSGSAGVFTCTSSCASARGISFCDRFESSTTLPKAFSPKSTVSSAHLISQRQRRLSHSSVLLRLLLLFPKIL